MRSLLMVWSLGCLSFLSATGFACSKHPGMTHEQWTSSMANEEAKFKVKNQTDAGFSNDFWTRKVASPRSQPPASNAPADAAGSASGERPIREVPVN